MDAEQFDRATRRALFVLGGSGLAVLLGLGETAGKHKKHKKLKVCLHGQTISVPKKKRNQFLLNGATLGACVAATCSDGIRNGDETGVDCGGSCPRCADGLACLDGADCQSSFCTANLASPTGKACGTCSAMSAACGAGCHCLRVDGSSAFVCISDDTSQIALCDATCSGARICVDQGDIAPVCLRRCGS